MPGKSEQSKKRKTSVKVQDMRAKQNPKAGKNTEAKAKPIFTTVQHTESTKRLPCCWARNKSSLLRFRQQKPQHPTSNAQRPIQKGRALASSLVKASRFTNLLECNIGCASPQCLVATTT